jgi:hypothetical protein
MADVAGTATGLADPAKPDAERSAGLVLAALAVAGLVVSVMQTLALPLLPEFMRAFHTSVSAVTWVFTATLLAGAVATPARCSPPRPPPRTACATANDDRGSGPRWVGCTIRSAPGQLVIGRRQAARQKPGA